MIFFRSEVKLASVENIRTPFLPVAPLVTRYSPGLRMSCGRGGEMIFSSQNHRCMNSVIF